MIDDKIINGTILMLVGAIVAISKNTFIMYGGVVMFWFSVIYIIKGMFHDDK